MDRKEFLPQLGLGTAGVVLFGCMGNCKKDTVPAAPPETWTLDFTTAYAPLISPVGYA